MSKMQKLFAIGFMVALGSAFFAGTLLAGNQKVWDDPDKGKTREQVAAGQEAMSQRFWARYPGWVSEQVASGIDPSKLPAAAILASVSPPAGTLRDSSKMAALVVHGRVTHLDFRPEGDTVATFDVDEFVKGAAGRSISVHFPGGLQPWPDWDHPTLAYLEAAPILMPNEEAMLFLNAPAAAGGPFEPQMYTGVYRVTAGVVQPLEGNPFAGSVVKSTRAMLSASVVAALGN